MMSAFFRNDLVKNEVNSLLKKRDGLMCGICNGFQALIKLGLVPFGEIVDTDESCPTLTFNKILRHQSKIVRIRIASNDVRFNPNGSVYAIEGITSPDGRVFGKMGHSERIGNGLYKNVLGNYDMHIFESAVDYFK